MRYSQNNTSEMFINIPFIFAASKVLQLRNNFESPAVNERLLNLTPVSGCEILVYTLGSSAWASHDM